ncbi:hypothetical protein [Paracoccus sp. KR1-242]|uniref:hypothetical protein n=1 Tax=Paracoccus sp. KR1-242 TaxID=3410028 RepID=UPI003C0277B6
MMTAEDTRRLYRDPGARADALKIIEQSIATMNSWASLSPTEAAERRETCKGLRAAAEVLK